MLTFLSVSDSAMAKQIGRTREAVRQIRAGITYADRCPDIPRRKKAVDCLSCKHWRDRCGFNFPDPIEEGVGFANECILYAE